MPNNCSCRSDLPSELWYDGSGTGCLCALAEACRRGGDAPPVFVPPGAGRSLFAGAVREVPSSPEAAERFLRVLAAHSSEAAVLCLLRVLAARPGGAEPRLYRFVRLTLRLGAEALSARADPDVAFVLDWSRKVGAEVHRFKGLLRFQAYRSGRWVALYEPDFEITAPLALHFRRRLAGQSWVILDCRRRHAATWNGARLNAETPDGGLLEGETLQRCLAGDAPSEREAQQQRLWRTFHRTVAIPTRRNPALQRQFLPLRYWNHLTECIPPAEPDPC